MRSDAIEHFAERYTSIARSYSSSICPQAACTSSCTVRIRRNQNVRYIPYAIHDQPPQGAHQSRFGTSKCAQNITQCHPNDVFMPALYSEDIKRHAKQRKACAI